MLREYAQKSNIDFESLNESNFQDEYDKRKYFVRNDTAVSLAKQYAKQVRCWLDSLTGSDSYAMEIRLQDTMLADCLEVVQWYQYLLEVKLVRALVSKKDEEEDQMEAYDSLGNAKLLLVSIERNIAAWGYLYHKFKDDEVQILDTLICLQKLNREVEQVFPDARSFIRAGLDA